MNEKDEILKEIMQGLNGLNFDEGEEYLKNKGFF